MRGLWQRQQAIRLGIFGGGRADTLKKKSEQERFAVPARFNIDEILLFISAFFSSLL
jgi:hypothetical protein